MNDRFYYSFHRPCYQKYYCMSESVVDKWSASIKTSGTNCASNSSYYNVPQINPLNNLSYGAVRHILQHSVMDSEGKAVYHVSNDIMQSILAATGNQHFIMLCLVA